MLAQFFRMVWVSVLVMGMLGGRELAPQVQAAGQIVVNTFDDVVDPTGTSGLCSLRQAVYAANVQLPVGACTGVSAGGDTLITLPAGTYVLTRTSGSPAWTAGPLVITNSVSVVASGGTATLGGDGAWNRRLITVGSEATAVPGATLTLRNVILQGGRDATSGGGAVLVGRQSTLLAEGVTLFDNRTTGAGGGVLNFGGRVTLNRTIILSNSAGLSGGGGLYNASPIGFIGFITLSQSSVVSNAVTVAEQFGGGMVNDGGVLLVRNTTISHNRATADGGGVFAQTGSNNRFNNVTLAYNQASLNTTSPTSGGGGIRNFSAFQLANSVVAHNTSGSGATPDDCTGSSITSIGYNLVHTPTDMCFVPGSSDLPTNTLPLLNDVRPFGGQWVHWPQPASPLWLAGDPATPTGYPACEPTDQLGLSRLNRRCDIGAVRLALFLFLPAVMR